MTGKLIVIEGTDAVGKRTQAELLAAKLKASGKKAEIMNFPTYGSTFGRLVRKYLQGRFGKQEELHPEMVAMLYALDRHQYKGKIFGLLKKGVYVICNRYLQSNLYQAAKISGKKKRKAFISYLAELEKYLPRADAVIFLNLPISISSKLLKKRGRKIDIHEKDAAYQERVRKTYVAQGKAGGWVIIDCFDGQGIKPKKEIAKELFAKLAKKI